MSRTQSTILALIFLVALVEMFVYRASSSAVDPDVFHEMALAREAWQLGRIPWADSFSYVPTVYPTVHHEWGAGVIAYAAASLMGAAGVMVIKWLLSFGIALICWSTARKRGVHYGLFGLLAIVSIFLAENGFSTIRAQLYSFFCVAVLLNCFDRDREGSRRWLIPWLVLYVIWLNVHAGFLFGAGLFFIHWVERLVRRERNLHLLATGIVMALLISLNPYGIHYYSYLWRATTMPRPMIGEWASLWEAGEPHRLVAYAVACGLALYAFVADKGKKFHGFSIVAVTAIYALLHGRMAPFFAIAWLSYVPAQLQQTSFGASLIQTWENRKPQWIAIWSLAAIAMAVAIKNTRPWELRVPGTRRVEVQDMYYPVGIVGFLRAHGFQGNLMLPFDHGGYVLWKLTPDVKVAIDSRYEVAYPAGTLEDNLALYMVEGDWQSMLTRHGTDGVIVPRWTPLEDTLSAIAEKQLSVSNRPCRLVYRDDTFSLYMLGDSMPRIDPVNREGERIVGRFP